MIVLMFVTHWNMDVEVHVGGYGKGNEGNVAIGEGDVYGMSKLLVVELELFSVMTHPCVS